MGPPFDVYQQSWSRIGVFRERAALVLSCDIARRADLPTFGSTFKLLARMGQPDMQVVREHPPISEIESAAARLRPLFTPGDPAQWGTITAALRHLTRKAPPEARETVKTLKSAWSGFDSMHYWSMAVSEGTPDWENAPVMWDRQLAKAWLYGSLVHHDVELRAKTRNYPERELMMAGLLWVRDGILLTRGTQQIVQDLEDAGLLERHA